MTLRPRVYCSVMTYRSLGIESQHPVNQNNGAALSIYSLSQPLDSVLHIQQVRQLSLQALSILEIRFESTLSIRIIQFVCILF